MRNLVVSRARAGTCGNNSVNDPREHAASRHRHLRLCHTSRSGACPYGTSLGLVTACPLTEVDSTPHDGQPAALSSSVTTCTTRTPPP